MSTPEPFPTNRGAKNLMRLGTVLTGGCGCFFVILSLELKATKVSP